MNEGNFVGLLKYNIEIETKATIDHLGWRHYSFQTCSK